MFSIHSCNCNELTNAMSATFLLAAAERTATLTATVSPPATTQLSDLSSDALVLLLPHWRLADVRAAAATCHALYAALRTSLAAGNAIASRLLALSAKVMDARTPVDASTVEGIHQRILALEGSGQPQPLRPLVRFDAEGRPRATFAWPVEFYYTDTGEFAVDWCRTGLDAADMAVASRALHASHHKDFGYCCELLDLSFNQQIGDAGCASLAAALPAMTALQVLEMQECGLGDAAVCALVDGLASDGCVMRSLCLGSNPIGDEGCAALARALQTSSRLLLRSKLDATPVRSLKILQLGDTSIGDAGANELARALEAGAMMPHGLQLWLASTRISGHGTDAARGVLMGAASRHPSLRVCW